MDSIRRRPPHRPRDDPSATRIFHRLVAATPRLRRGCLATTPTTRSSRRYPDAEAERAIQDINREQRYTKNNARVIKDYQDISNTYWALDKDELEAVGGKFYKLFYTHMAKPGVKHRCLAPWRRDSEFRQLEVPFGAIVQTIASIVSIERSAMDPLELDDVWCETAKAVFTEQRGGYVARCLIHHSGCEIKNDDSDALFAEALKGLEVQTLEQLEAKAFEELEEGDQTTLAEEVEEAEEDALAEFGEEEDDDDDVAERAPKRRRRETNEVKRYDDADQGRQLGAPAEDPDAHFYEVRQQPVWKPTVGSVLEFAAPTGYELLPKPVNDFLNPAEARKHYVLIYHNMLDDEDKVVGGEWFLGKILHFYPKRTHNFYIGWPGCEPSQGRSQGRKEYFSLSLANYYEKKKDAPPPTDRVSWAYAKELE